MGAKMNRGIATFAYGTAEYALRVTVDKGAVIDLTPIEPQQMPVELVERIGALDHLAGGSDWADVVVLAEASPRFDFLVRAINAALNQMEPDRG
jgi:hypothetical protein